MNNLSYINMDAIILAGGKGNRMETALPKALVAVKGKPILAWQIDYLLKSGIEKIVLAIGHKSKEIIDYVKKNHKDVQIDFTIEEDLLGTAGGLKLALQKCSSEFDIIEKLRLLKNQTDTSTTKEQST